MERGAGRGCARQTASGHLPSTRDSFHCPHCGAFAGQFWTVLGRDTDEGFDSLESRWEPDPWDEKGPPVSNPRWRGSSCASCQRWSIWNLDEMVYPRRRLGGPTHPEMPEAIRELHEEAAAVAAVSRRAGAAMARAAIESLIKAIDTDAPKKVTLEDRIRRLQGQVSTPLGRMLDVVRVTGNGVLHQSTDSPSDIVVLALDDTEGPELVGLLLEAANDLVEELITRPRVAAELWNRLPESIRDRSEFGDDPA